MWRDRLGKKSNAMSFINLNSVYQILYRIICVLQYSNMEIIF